MPARTSPSGAGPRFTATRSDELPAPSNSIPVLLRIACSTLLMVEFSACTVSIPSRYVTCGGAGGISAGRAGLGTSGAGYGGPMGSVEADAFGGPGATGSFLGATTPTCGLTGAPAAGLRAGAKRVAPAGVPGLATFALGDRGATGARYCGREPTPVLICGAVLCCPRAGSASRRDKPQIVRESRAIGIFESC